MIIIHVCVVHVGVNEMPVDIVCEVSWNYT